MNQQLLSDLDLGGPGDLRSDLRGHPRPYLYSTELVSDSGVQASIDLSHATFLSLYNGIRLPIVESM